MSVTAVDNQTSISDAVAVLTDSDPACADRQELGELMAVARRVRGFLDGFDIACARRGRQLNAQGQSESPTGLFLNTGCGSGKEAHATETREHVCGELPEFETALAAGHVSNQHLDALARGLRNMDDQERGDLKDRTELLLDLATSETAETFDKHLKAIITGIKDQYRPDNDLAELEQQRRNSNITDWIDQHTGIRKTLIELDPLRHEQWWRLYKAHLARLKNEPGSNDKTWQQLKVEAFLATTGINTGTGVNTGNTNNTTTTTTGAPSASAAPGVPAVPVPRVPKVIVLIDLTTLLHGRHPATIAELTDGTPVPLAHIRQLLCDANIAPAILGTHNEVLHLGRTTRLATRAQRDALRATYRTCIEPGCTVPVDDCHAHHLAPWEHGGTTDLHNLAPLCPDGHDKVHTKGWTLTITNPHNITWTRPDGTTSYHGPAPNLRHPHRPTEPP